MPRAQSWPWSGICVPWCYKDDPFGVLKSVFPTHLFFTQDHLYLETQKAKVKNISFPHRVWWQFLGIMSLLYIVLPKIWTPLDLGKKVFLLFFFSFLCLFGSVSCHDVTWWDDLWSFFLGWGGERPRQSSFDAGKLPLPPNALLCVLSNREFCPTSLPSPISAALTRFGSSSWWEEWCSSWDLLGALELCEKTPSFSSL